MKKLSPDVPGRLSQHTPQSGTQGSGRRHRQGLVPSAGGLLTHRLSSAMRPFRPSDHRPRDNTRRTACTLIDSASTDRIFTSPHSSTRSTFRSLTTSSRPLPARSSSRRTWSTVYNEFVAKGAGADNEAGHLIDAATFRIDPPGLNPARATGACSD